MSPLNLFFDNGLLPVGQLRGSPKLRHLEIEHMSPPAKTLLIAEQGILP
jgi:hypothetical protein